MTLPASDDATALIKARYTPEEAELLTNMPFDPKTIEELAEIRQMTVEELKPRLDALAKKGVVWKIFHYGADRYPLCDPFLVFYRSVCWGRGQKFRAPRHGAPAEKGIRTSSRDIRTHAYPGTEDIAGRDVDRRHEGNPAF